MKDVRVTVKMSSDNTEIVASGGTHLYDLLEQGAVILKVEMLNLAGDTERCDYYMLSNEGQAKEAENKKPATGGYVSPYGGFAFGMPHVVPKPTTPPTP